MTNSALIGAAHSIPVMLEWGEKSRSQKNLPNDADLVGVDKALKRAAKSARG